MVKGQSSASPSGLRIAAFHVEPEACLLVRDWADARGHDIVLLVTTPGPPPRTYRGYQEIVAASPPRQEVLVTTRFRRAAPILAAARPDLVLSYTFPYRLPQAISDLAPLGAVNLHPAPLPRYRGPNPHRMIFDGEPTIGAALHRLAPEFDAGQILSVREASLPRNLTLETVRELYDRLIVAALDEGVARAAAGEPGDEQDEEQSSYAASFSPDDFLLDWSLPADVLRRRTIALNLVEDRAAGVIDGELRRIAAVDPVISDGAPTTALPGAILERDGSTVVVRVEDGFARITLAASDAQNRIGQPMPLKAPRHMVLPR